MKFDYTWNDGIKSMLEHITFPVDNCRVVVQLHYYMLGIIMELDEVCANMEYIRTNIGLRGIMDMIKVIRTYFSNCIYTWDDISYEITKTKSGMSLTCNYAELDIRTARDAMMHDMLKDYIYLPLITVLNCYDIGCCDWEDILESDLSPEVKITMMYTKHIIPEGAAVCNADIILEMVQRVINKERLKSTLENETDNHFTEVCTRVLLLLAGVYQEMTHERLFDKYIGLPDITAATKNVISKLYPDRPDWICWCDDDDNQFKFKWVCCDPPSFGRWTRYKFSGSTISVPQRFMSALTSGRLKIFINSTIYTVSKDPTGESWVVGNNIRPVLITDEPDSDGIYHVELCEKFDLDISVNSNELTFNLIPTSNTDAIFFTNKVIDVTLSCTESNENTKLADAPKIKRELPKPDVLQSWNVEVINETDDYLTFSWKCDGDEGYGMHVYRVATIEVPERFTHALRGGHIKVYIRDGSLNTVLMYMVIPEDNGTKHVSCGSLKSGVFAECVIESEGGLYRADICEKFGLCINRIGNILVFSGVTRNMYNIPLLCTEDVITVSLAIRAVSYTHLTLPTTSRV